MVVDVNNHQQHHDEVVNNLIMCVFSGNLDELVNSPLQLLYFVAPRSSSTTRYTVFRLQNLVNCNLRARSVQYSGCRGSEMLRLRARLEAEAFPAAWWAPSSRFGNSEGTPSKLRDVPGPGR